jgi:hypothetical protein
MIPSENKSFTAVDIERYHKGTMSPEERHALEKAALDDPFLADALEGYVYTESPAADLAILQKRLDEKSGRRKIIPLFARTWMRSAAVIILVIAGGWLVYRTLSPEQKSTAIAKQKTVREVASAPVISPSDSATTNTQFSTDTTRSIAIAHGRQNDKQNRVTAGSLKVSDMSLEDLGTTADTSKMNNGLADYSYKDYRNQQDNARVNGNVNLDTKQTNATFYQDKKPAAAGMNNAVSERSFKENANGRADSLYAKTLAMQKAEKKTNDTIQNFDVVLKQQQAPPAEVVVIAHGTQKKRTADPRMQGIVLDTLEPAEGWTNFDDYIANNLQRPAELQQIKQPTGGEVQLSFDVNDVGEPVNIKVEKSLCPQCDDEAIRLLKQGPKSNNNKNKKGKVTIRF